MARGPEGLDRVEGQIGQETVGLDSRRVVAAGACLAVEAASPVGAVASLVAADLDNRLAGAAGVSLVAVGLDSRPVGAAGGNLAAAVRREAVIRPGVGGLADQRGIPAARDHLFPLVAEVAAPVRCQEETGSSCGSWRTRRTGTCNSSWRCSAMRRRGTQSL